MELYTLESDFLKLSVNGRGAELSSIKCKRTGREYLWQRTAPFWESSSPILFPMVGRLKDGKYYHDGYLHEMPIHGFAPASEFALTTESNKLIFTLQDSHATRQIYPFEFLLQVTFSLECNQLFVEYKVTNPSNNMDLIFGIGGHPGFMCPITKILNSNCCYLEFDNTELLTGTIVTKAGFLSDKTYQLHLENSCLPLSYGLFEKYLTLVFVDINTKKVTLKSKRDGTLVSMNFYTSHFAVWTQPGAHFICLEPWDGLPDYENSCGDYVKKRGNHVLPPRRIKSFSYNMCIGE